MTLGPSAAHHRRLGRSVPSARIRSMPSTHQPSPTQPEARLILASQSPRRRELMLQAGYRFEVLRRGA